MKFKIFASGTSQTVGKNQEYGIGIVLIFIDNYNRQQIRELSFYVGQSDPQTIEYHATKLALLCIAPKYRQRQTTIYTANSSVATTLISSSCDSIKSQELLELYRQFSNIIIEVIAGNNNYLSKAKQLAVNTILSKIDYDSNTNELNTEN